MTKEVVEEFNKPLLKQPLIDNWPPRIVFGCHGNIANRRATTFTHGTCIQNSKIKQGASTYSARCNIQSSAERNGPETPGRPNAAAHNLQYPIMHFSPPCFSCCIIPLNYHLQHDNTCCCFLTLVQRCWDVLGDCQDVSKEEKSKDLSTRSASLP